MIYCYLENRSLLVRPDCRQSKQNILKTKCLLFNIDHKTLFLILFYFLKSSLKNKLIISNKRAPETLLNLNIYKYNVLNEVYMGNKQYFENMTF